ncbi:hypothetical protein PV721_42830, partial [Streptomyces sp. MB09-01]|uniref:hypothetical protein n=1 Tax=Streptomyces sp. MB09-01 TaxID=3028666 RepID=UPI0029BF91BB
APGWSASCGGPLLLRALRPPHEADQPGAGDTPQTSRRVRADAPAPAIATSSRPGSPGTRGPAADPVASGPGAPVPNAAPQLRGGASTHTAAVLGTPAPAVQRAGATGSRAAVTPAAPDRAPAPPRFPLVRRIAMVPDASASRGASAGGAAPSPSGPPVQRSAAHPYGSTGSTSAPAATGARPGRNGGATPADDTAGTAAVRPRAVGRTLTVARVPATPRRRVAAIRPAPARTAPVTTTAVQRAESRGPLGTRDADTPVRGAESRTPLTAPLTELPSTVTPSDRSTAAHGPALPVVQRRAEPAAAGGATPHNGGPNTTPQDRAEKPATPAKPTVQRRADSSAEGAATPGNGAAKPSTQRPAEPAAGPGTPVQRPGSRPPLGMPFTELHSTATPSDHPATAPAPAPVMPVVQRQAEPDSGPPKPAPERRAEPMAQRHAEPPARGAAPPDSGGPKPTAQRRTEPAAGPGTPVQRAGSRLPLGAPLTEPPTTVTPSGRPAAAPAPAMPVVQRQAEPAAEGGATPRNGGPNSSPQQRAERPTAPATAMPQRQAEPATGPDAAVQRTAGPAAGPGTPVQRAGSRPPLGAPLTELPATAVPSGRPAGAPAPAPAMPVVERQAEPGAVQRTAGPAAGPGTPVQRAGSRPPLGAPLTELPATAVPSGRPAGAPAPAPAMPVVERQAEPSAGAAPQLRPGSPAEATHGSGPGRSASRVRTGLGAPLPSLPPSAAPPASPSYRSRAPRPASPADVQRAPAPGAPATGHTRLLGAGDVQRRRGGGPGAPSGSARPVPLVVARSVTDRTAGDATAAPSASRTLQLLAARPLPLGTRDMGSAAAPAPRPAGRPVVAARWPAPSAPQVQRAAGDGLRGGHVVRPAPGPRYA